MVSASENSSLFSTFSVFQANNREVDLSLVRDFYRPYIGTSNDYLGMVGSYDFHILSAPPEPTLNYATVLKPYGALIWALIAISLVAVMVTFVMIERLSCVYCGYTKIPTHQS